MRLLEKLLNLSWLKREKDVSETARLTDGGSFPVSFVYERRPPTSKPKGAQRPWRSTQAWWPMIRGDVAIFSDGTRTEMRPDGWRRVRLSA